MRDREPGDRVEYGASHLLAALPVGARQHGYHFLAAVTRHAVARPRAGRVPDGAGHVAQAPIARLVPVAVVVGLEVVDVDHHDRDDVAVADGLLPDAMDLALERGAVQQSREPVVRGYLAQQAPVEEGGAVGVLERVAARAGVEVRADEKEGEVEAELRRHAARGRCNQEARQRQQVGAHGGLEGQAEHEIEEEDRDDEARIDEGGERALGLHRKQHGREAVERREEVHERPVPAVEAA